MGKAPASQFYWSDWLGDVQLQSASDSTKGIWMNTLARMWYAPERGKLSGTREQLIRIIGCQECNFDLFLTEAKELGFCDISVTNNGVSQIYNRRMFRESKEKENNRLRQQRHREKKQGNAEITPPSSSSSSSSTSKKKIYSEKQFKIFYEKYPIKKSKKAALKAWKKNKPDLNICLKAIEAQKAEKKELKDAGEFCPEWKHPATWINKGCWDDEIIKTENANERDAFLRRHGATE